MKYKNSRGNAFWILTKHFDKRIDKIASVTYTVNSEKRAGNKAGRRRGDVEKWLLA